MSSCFDILAEHIDAFVRSLHKMAQESINEMLFVG